MFRFLSSRPGVTALSLLSFVWIIGIAVAQNDDADESTIRNPQLERHLARKRLGNDHPRVRQIERRIELLRKYNGSPAAIRPLLVERAMLLDTVGPDHPEIRRLEQQIEIVMEFEKKNPRPRDQAEKTTDDAIDRTDVAAVIVDQLSPEQMKILLAKLLKDVEELKLRVRDLEAKAADHTRTVDSADDRENS